MFNQNLLARLGRAVKNVFALSTSLLTAPVLAMTAVTGQGLGTFRLEGVGDGRRQVAELAVQAGSPLQGQTLARVAGPRDVQLVAHLPAAGPARFLHEADPEARLAEGDRLVVCGPPRDLAALLAEAGLAEEGDLLWAGWLRRQARVARRTLGEIDKSVLICTGILVAVVVASTLVLRFGVAKFRLEDALFRTISVMATGASMEESDYSGWTKVYVSLLRLVGAALLAAFTAIFTNYLLRARLGGALEVRRIPDGGHVIVCGLTPVGFRTVEELAASGQRVVVIEMAADNRFVATVRRLGAAVVVGDATVAEVLRQAHAARARAVIAATNNDLVNLEVALLVRELNPAQRVVLLLSDVHLAQMLREAADVRLAVSVPALAAPAFVAGLYGDRVLNVFLVRGRLLAVIDLVVQPQDRLLADQSVRAVAVDYRLVPVALVPAQGPPPRQPLGARLAAGDRLAAIIVLPDLERLLQRQPSPAVFAVEVTACPLPTRDWLAGLVRTQCGLSAEEAAAALGRMPLRLGTRLTRGQAEDLLALLARERVTARLCEAEAVGPPETPAC
jgi:Trk K+ transport system NAD-binding subunit